MKRIVAVALLAGGIISCRGEQDPLSNDHHLAARAAGRELTISALEGLFAQSTPPRRPTLIDAIAVSTMWTDFHELAASAARNDTLDVGFEVPVQLLVNEMKVNKFLDGLSQRPAGDTATEPLYLAAAHGLIGARHIFLAFPRNATPTQHDSVIKAAISLRAQLRPETFATSVRHFVMDGSPRSHAENLGVVDSTQVHPGLFRMVKKMAYDSISIPVVVGDGVEIVQRMSWMDAHEQFTRSYRIAAARALAANVADVALDRADVRVEEKAVSILREALTDRDRAALDSTQIGNYSGEFIFTVRDFMDWLDVAALDRGRFRNPGPDMRGDERMGVFLDMMIAHKILLRSADSAKIIVTAAERDSIKRELTGRLRQVWSSLGVSPDSLRIRAADDRRREILAHARADSALHAELNGGLHALVPPLVHRALQDRYKGLISVFALKFWIEQLL